jgi:nicotinamidase-related amidase
MPQALLLIDFQNDDFPGGADTLAGVEAVKTPPV